MIRKKKCSSCLYFEKIDTNCALCDFFDARTLSGRGRCKNWKGIKYKRIKKHNNQGIQSEII